VAFFVFQPLIELKGEKFMTMKTESFGGGGGGAFPRAIVKELGLRAATRVDQIRINGNSYGGSGGSDKGSIILGDDEYISRVDIRSATAVDSVKFTTNKKNSVGGGGSGGGPTLLDGIRVVAIGGRSGTMVDNLEIMYISDYQPSKVINTLQGFILGYTPQFEKISEYISSESRTDQSYERVTEHMMNQTYSASVEGEYYVKVAASTQIEVKDSSLTTVKSELEQKLKKDVTTEIDIPAGYVGILLSNGTVMQGADGQYWMFPTSVLSYSVIQIAEVDNVLDHYDLTGELYTQMPDLKKYKKMQNGYVYYGA